MDGGSFRVSDLLLPEWSTDEVLLTGFQVVQAQDMEVGSDIRLRDVRVFVLRGSLEYITAGGWDVREVDDENFELRLGPVQRITSPLGVYLLVVTPNDGQAGERVHDAASLAAAVLGGAVIYRELFMNVLSASEQGTAIKGPDFGPPKNFPAPSLDADSIRQYKEAYVALGSAVQDVKARVQLSLRWFEEAHHRFNEDSLLRYWFAIETLAMPNTADIRPANQLLANAYGKTEQEIRSEVELGRLQGLRSNIVHKGLTSPLDPRLLNFAAAVYADLLEATLGLPCRKRATTRKAAIGPSIAPLIPPF